MGRHRPRRFSCRDDASGDPMGTICQILSTSCRWKISAYRAKLKLSNGQAGLESSNIVCDSNLEGKIRGDRRSHGQTPLVAAAGHGLGRGPDHAGRDRCGGRPALHRARTRVGAGGGPLGDQRLHAGLCRGSVGRRPARRPGGLGAGLPNRHGGLRCGFLGGGLCRRRGGPDRPARAAGAWGPPRSFRAASP